MPQLDKRIIKTREKVLDAARKLILTKGISNVTHLTVAERSGVGRQTIYRHWPTVNDLLADALSSASFPPEPNTGNIAEDLKIHLSALAKALEEGPLDYILIALNERAQFEPEIAELRDRLMQQGCAGLVSLLDRGVERAELKRSLNAEVEAAKLEGPIFYFALVKRSALQEEFVKSLVDEFLERNTSS